MKNYQLTTFVIALLSAPALSALPEPDTVFYGRIVHLGGGEEYVLTSGELRWLVQPPAGSTAPPAEIKAQLSAMKGGALSYQIRVPHYLQVSGTTLAVLAGLPLNTSSNAQPFRNAAITLDGLPLRMADPAGITFDASSLTRGSFRRLDLIVDGALPDADNDGLPNWWETKYHLDPNAADAGGDPDHDGINNLAEYRAGTDPTGNSQDPHLPNEVLVSLPLGGRAIPVLRARDEDSTADQLTYTVGTVPAGVSIGRIGHTGPLGFVSTFTQADLDAGRIVISHGASSTDSYSVELTLRDETPTHAPAITTLLLSVAAEATLWEGWGLPTAAMPSSLPAIEDGSKLSGGAMLRAPTGSAALNSLPTGTSITGEVPRLFIGSNNADTLLGSAKADLIMAGEGDSVRLGAGADRLLLSGAKGTVTVVDFSNTEHDVIDLRGVLQPVAGRWLPAYVQMVGSELRVDANGDGSGFTDLTIKLANAILPAEVADLWDSGGLETGGIVPQTTLFLTTTGQPSEEYLTPALVTVRRRGDVSDGLDVPVTWSGTAVMGRDYATLPPSAHFAAGQKSVTFSLQPLADDEREPAESVQITLATNTAWMIASGNSTTTLSIADLPSRVWLEIAERTAYKDSLSPAQILVRRSGPMAAALTVQLLASGRAVANLDYRRLPASVTFAAAQDVLSLDVIPLAFGTLTRGAEDVLVSVKVDASYLFGSTPQARVMIVERPRSLATWMGERGVSGNNFTYQDVDRDGLNGLLEFAFNRNPVLADVPPIQVLRDGSGRLGVEYQRWPGAPELTYRLQQSSGLADWTDVPESARDETESEILASGIERVRVYLRTAPSTGSGFLRICVDIAE